MSAELLAGWARADITPPVGVHMGGYWGRTSGARGVLDALEARALVLADGTSRIAVLVLDIVALAAVDVRTIRERIVAATGMTVDGVMVCCTHTHAGPLTLAFRGMGEMDAGYMSRLRDTAVDVVTNAAADLTPVTLRYGRAPVQLGVNRRDPQGPVIASVHALEITSAQSRAVVFSHACHPVVMGPANHEISAEFPGAAVRRIEASGFAFAMFVNGACADVNPRLTHGSHDQVIDLGEELAQSVAAALEPQGEKVGPPLAARRITVDLPLIEPPGRAGLVAELAVLRSRALIGKLRAGNDYWRRLILQAQIEWTRDALEDIRRAAPPSTPFEIQALRVGSLVLLGMEGEIFARYQLDIEKASPQQALILCGYANGCIGYVPTADEFERGGYEVGSRHRFRMRQTVEAYKVYPSTRRLAPECDAIIRATVDELLSSAMAARE